MGRFSASDGIIGDCETCLQVLRVDFGLASDHQLEFSAIDSPKVAADAHGFCAKTTHALVLNNCLNLVMLKTSLSDDTNRALHTPSFCWHGY